MSLASGLGRSGGAASSRDVNRPQGMVSSGRVEPPDAGNAMRRLYSPGWPSRNDLLDDLAVHVGQAIVATLETVGEFLVVEAEQVQDARLQVVHVDRIVSDTEAEVVG